MAVDATANHPMTPVGELVRSTSRAWIVPPPDELDEPWAKGVALVSRRVCSSTSPRTPTDEIRHPGPAQSWARATVAPTRPPISRGLAISPPMWEQRRWSAAEGRPDFEPSLRPRAADEHSESWKLIHAEAARQTRSSTNMFHRRFETGHSNNPAKNGGRVNNMGSSRHNICSWANSVVGQND